MYIVYHCFGGAHSSPVAAPIHVGLLPDDGRVPDGRAIASAPYFDKTPANRWGELLPVGQDADGHQVFVMGHGPHHTVAQNALTTGYRLAGGEAREILLVNTLPCVNAWMRIGGYLSRRLGLVRVGRPLVIWGTRRAYPQIAALVRETRARCRSGSAEHP